MKNRDVFHGFAPRLPFLGRKGDFHIFLTVIQSESGQNMNPSQNSITSFEIPVYDVDFSKKTWYFPAVDSGSLFSTLAAFKDPVRFFCIKRGDKIYIFDSCLNDYWDLSPEMSRLFTAGSQNEFSSLYKRLPAGVLDEEIHFLTQILSLPDKPLPSPVIPGVLNYLQINPGTVCNLSCKYCFREKNPKRMQDETIIDRAVRDLVLRYGPDAKDYTISFGLTSEPFLQIQLLERLATEAAKLEKQVKKPITIVFITNGTIYNEKTLKLTKKLRSWRHVNISIDGPREVHDAMRIDKQGNGTWDTVMRTIGLYQKNHIPVKAEGVITNNFPFPGKIVESYLDMGVVHINLKPVRDGTPYSFSLESIEKLKAGYEEYFQMLFTSMSHGDFKLFHILREDYAMRPLKKILCNKPSPRRCFWGVNVVSLDHEGNYYPCLCIIGNEKFKVGDLDHGIDFNLFHRDMSCLLRHPCSTCWARFLCGGTCHVNSWIAKNDIMAIDPVECSLSKYLVERSLLLIYDLLQTGFPKHMLEETAREIFY